MKKLLAILLLICSFTSCNEFTKSSEEKNAREFIPDHDKNPVISTAETIALKNGYLQWNEVDKIDFTFNVDRGDSHFERSWSWEPKTENVTKRSAKDTVSYNRSQMDSITRKIDASFINDKYWLLAPFNLAWDEGTTFSEEENSVAPISKDTLRKLTVVYGNEGGYTPGDAYDFYFGKDYEIKEWVFRKGNDSVPSMINTWEDYETFKGIKIAKMHQDSTGNFKLYFTNISVQ
tara:strand:- start:23206 stop:23904 length:699 start_codon:yes stop_codon:yes gene_type:complete